MMGRITPPPMSNLSKVLKDDLSNLAQSQTQTGFFDEPIEEPQGPEWWEGPPKLGDNVMAGLTWHGFRTNDTTTGDGMGK